ncbi:type II toxin-antitoxin system YafQ family toxin [Lactobacillus sp. CC-MHH1034]|nr:type II toxin-antitoxin system YafQ family toxin [Agrilactobacillus fermenti]MCD2257319.1 type II toxin-antitoxin system YafQ family toxin [Agrilactobacillus fermenti]
MPHYQSRFKKHLQQMIRNGHFKKAEFETLMQLLLQGKPLPEQANDHPISNRKHQRAFFVKHSWLVIYQYNGNIIRFLDVGRHGEV